mmetsp:Transcript_44243/g.125158  ORF Transcript_44243/g.125158 Transcript_44243/m.125158 type:complete len:454 (-) Transcript_44243:460-1821(-)
MEPLTRVNATSQLDLQVVTLLESLDERRKDNTYDISKALTQHGASDGSAASGDDLLLLNVGGSVCCVRRKHLTSSKGSLLAVLLGGRWDGRLIRDAENRVFIDVCPRAFEAMLEGLLEGGKDALDRLMDEAKTRNYQGAHDFWTAVLLSPIDKPSTDASSAAQGHSEEPTVTSHGLPAELRGVVAEVESFVKTFVAKKNDLDSERAAKKAAYDQTMMEITAVKPFLAPLSGGDAIRSVDVCGQTVSTTQSTLDVMGDIALTNRFNLWPAPIEDVPVDHIRRLVDHYRRKRLGASTEDIDAPLKIGKNAEQAAFDINAAMYGVKTDTPTATDDGFLTSYHTPGCEVRYKVVREGFGRTPTLEQIAITDRVTWRDGFEGNVKDTECRKHMARVSQPGLGYLRDALLSMREGEVRRFICQEDGDVYYDEVSLLQVADDFVFEPPRRRRDYRQVLYA